MYEHDPIDKALGLRPISEAKEESGDIDQEEDQVPEIIEETSTEVVKPANTEALDDIEKARSNIENIIRQGDASLTDLITLAKMSDSPRGYEVVANMMKTLLEANKDFADMSIRKKYEREEIEGPKEEAQTNVTNNNLILSTNDLLELIKGNNNGD